MTFAYIGDSTVSNWSAKYAQDVLGGSEEASTVPYNVYMVMTFVGSGLGDLGVRRFGAVAAVRGGSVARSFAPGTDRYGDGHERPRTADVGRGSNGL